MAANQTVQINVEYRISTENLKFVYVQELGASGWADKLLKDITRAGNVTVNGSEVLSDDTLTNIDVTELESLPPNLQMLKHNLPILRQTMTPMWNPLKLVTYSKYMDCGVFLVGSIQRFSDPRSSVDFQFDSKDRFSIKHQSINTVNYVTKDGEAEETPHDVRVECDVKIDPVNGATVSAKLVVPKVYEARYLEVLENKLKHFDAFLKVEPDSVKVKSPTSILNHSLDLYNEEASFRRNHLGAQRGLISKLKELSGADTLSWDVLRDRALGIMAEEIEAGRDPFNTRTHASNRVLLDLFLLADQEAGNAEAEQIEPANVAESDKTKLKSYLLTLIRGQTPQKPEASNKSICAFYANLEWRDVCLNEQGAMVANKENRLSNLKQLIQTRKDIMSNTTSCSIAFNDIRVELLHNLKKRHFGLTWFFSFLPTIGAGENALKKALSSDLDHTKALVQVLDVLQDRLINSTSSKYGYYAGVLNKLGNLKSARPVVEGGLALLPDA